jgi:hypothetical protein
MLRSSVLFQACLISKVLRDSASRLEARFYPNRSDVSFCRANLAPRLFPSYKIVGIGVRFPGIELKFDLSVKGGEDSGCRKDWMSTN